MAGHAMAPVSVATAGIGHSGAGLFVPVVVTTLTCPSAALEQATYNATRLEQIERGRGLSAADARTAAARRAGVSPGTIEKLRKGRLKSVAVHLYGRLCDALVRALNEEKSRLEHELARVRGASLSVDPHVVRQAEAALAAARAALTRSLDA